MFDGGSILNSDLFWTPHVEFSEAVADDVGRGLTLTGFGVAAKAAFRVAKGIGKAASRAARASRGTAGGNTTVLGKYPQYIELAGKLNARRVNVPTKIWNKMTPAEQWAANTRFLDRTIARGDKIILANPVRDISKVSGYFRKELDYLIGKGYKLSKDGTQLIR